MLWHSRLSHVNHRTLTKMHQIVDGIPKFSSNSVPSFCESCTKAKSHRIPSRNLVPLPIRKLELVYSDVGIMPIASVGGHKYYSTFIEAKTQYKWTYPMKQKGDVKKILPLWKERAESESQEKLQRVRTDGGGEYDSHDLRQFFLKNGIKHEKTPAYTPEMNGVAERLNRTLTETAKAMLDEAELDES